MKRVILILICMFFTQSAFAEKIPVKIEPTKIISTHHDEIELGDWIPFVIVDDVYKDNRLYLKSTTPIYGQVDFFHPNGWAADYAEIKFEKFVTKDARGRKMAINYPLEIKGNLVRSNKSKYEVSTGIAGFFYGCSTILGNVFAVFRGSEIFVEPDTRIYNLIIEG